MADNNDINIFVERETYTKDDKEYFTHFIKGNVRGRDIKIGIAPPDIGGYTALDIVFGTDNRLPLVLKPYEIRDEKTHKVTRGVSFAVSSKDEATGKTYECTIKPARKSDKDLNKDGVAQSIDGTAWVNLKPYSAINLQIRRSINE